MKIEELNLNEGQTGNSIKADVICRATFKGRIPKGQLWAILEHIDGMKGRGFYFTKHERTDEDEWVTIDYELAKHGI